MPTILERIVRQTRQRLVQAPPDVAALERQVAALSAPPDGLAALRAPGIRVIAECKRASPSAGTIRASVEPSEVGRVYADAGAAAISVLTEPEHFRGSLEDLASVAHTVAVPCLRKDFIVERSQLLEARVAGASLALLIAAVLDDADLTRLIAASRELGLTPLVEAHTADEVRRSAACGADVIGINNRNLDTFEIDLATCESLRGLIPSEAIAIAESGIEGPADVRRLHAAGYSVFLVGSSLMRSGDPAAALKSLIGATQGPGVQ